MTPAERRFDALQRMGCICCEQEGNGFEPIDVHHLVDKGYRKHSGGHQASLPLCPWHHRGLIPSGTSESYMLESRGPSLARHKKRFVEHYGTERHLLDLVNSRLTQK